jgi:glycine cleavage system aminomethyltransferase T
MMVDGAEAEVTSAVVSPDSGKVVALAYVRVPRANTA